MIKKAFCSVVTDQTLLDGKVKDAVTITAYDLSGNILGSIAISPENLCDTVMSGILVPALFATVDKPRPKYTDRRLVRAIIVDSKKVPRKLRQKFIKEQVRGDYPGYTLLTQVNAKTTLVTDQHGVLTYFVTIAKRVQ